MRVIGGTARGVPLRAPPGLRTRPTPDRVREALFSSIAAEVAGADVLDLFAGSGALGIEALSRGAATAVFVDSDRRAARAIAANLTTTRLETRGRVVQADAAAVAGTPRLLGDPAPAFGLVFCDPPYAEPLPRLTALLDRLRGGGVLAPDALVVVERDRRDPALGQRLPSFLDHVRDRTYGDVLVRMMRVAMTERGS